MFFDEPYLSVLFRSEKQHDKTYELNVHLSFRDFLDLGFADTVLDAEFNAQLGSFSEYHEKEEKGV